MRLKRLENDWVEIRSGKSIFKIVGMDAREFPQFPKFTSEGLTTTPASVLRQMIEGTIFFEQDQLRLRIPDETQSIGSISGFYEVVTRQLQYAAFAYRPASLSSTLRMQ